MKKVAYFEADFDWDEWSSTAASFALPIIEHQHPLNFEPYKSTEQETQQDNWDTLFTKHKSGCLYKPRRYLFQEFNEFLETLMLQATLSNRKSVIFEVGCGYGCSIFPLVEAMLSESTGDNYLEIQQSKGACDSLYFIATDFSEYALEILKRNPLYSRYRSKIIDVFRYDLTTCSAELSISCHNTEVDCILCVFALSAIHPMLHHKCIQHMINLLSVGTQKNENNKKKKYILFRDYGLNDMTMFRHQRRIQPRTFLRQDNTLCHYFNIDDMLDISSSFAELQLLECRYATVINKNIKKQLEMRRVFLHAVFQVEVA